MVSLDRSTVILPVYVFHCTGETPVLLSFALANVASMLRMKCVLPLAWQCHDLRP